MISILIRRSVNPIDGGSGSSTSAANQSGFQRKAIGRLFGQNLKAHSFKLFYEKFKPVTAIRASLSNYHTEDWLINMPVYAIGEYFKTNQLAPESAL